MPQKQFLTFKAPVDSYPLGEMLMGIMRPGRYSGFDIPDLVGTTLNLTHSPKIQKVNEAGSLVTFGSFRMPTGVIIHEENPISVTIPTPPGNGQYFGIIYAEHNYQEIVGGNPATYAAIIGAVNIQTYPNLPDPTKQCILAQFQIQATPGGLFINLFPTPGPLLGDGDMAAYLNSIPYATVNVAGVVRKSNIDLSATSEQYSENTRYITPLDLRNTGVMKELSIGTLQSSTGSPQWVTQEITSAFGGQTHLMTKIKEWDVTWEENFGGTRYFRSLKQGYIPSTVWGESSSFPTPVIAQPQLMLNTSANRMYLIFWTNHNSNIANTKLIIHRNT